MTSLQTIRRIDDSLAQARYLEHCRTLTGHGRCDDVDLYRLEDGTEIECISPANDCRVIPVECDPAADRYPGYYPGE